MIRGLIFFGLLLLGLRAAFVFVSPIMKNTMLEAKMQDLASSRGLKSESDLRHEILDFIEEKQIDLASEAVYLELTERGCHFAAHYKTEATFLKYTRHYEFYPASSEAARTRARNHFRFAAMTRS